MALAACCLSLLLTVCSVQEVVHARWGVYDGIIFRFRD